MRLEQLPCAWGTLTGCNRVGFGSERGAAMIDFTSSLYLGLHHASSTLGHWSTLTLGRPAALGEPPGADEVAADLARLQGASAATLLPSTLHLFWDLLCMLGRGSRTALLLDAGAYPILHWAAEGARATGARLQRFAHHDVMALEQAAERAARAGLRPVIVCDGFCPGCNRTAPLRDYARIVHARGGSLVVDDTQALGVLGASPSSSCPYGRGGGGSLRWHGLEAAGIALGASLAKGFGAPLAVLSGSRELIDRFRRASRTRVHCSPPSVAAIRAARRALDASARSGETWRRRLLRLVLKLRAALHSVGLAAIGTFPFPVQSFIAARASTVAELHRRLAAGDVRTLLTRGCAGPAPRLTFIATARHTVTQIEQAGDLLARATVGADAAAATTA